MRWNCLPEPIFACTSLKSTEPAFLMSTIGQTQSMGFRSSSSSINITPSVKLSSSAPLSTNSTGDAVFSLHYLYKPRMESQTVIADGVSKFVVNSNSSLI
ncbi:unnamed protein product [Cuscuta europaea]|uniref:Uncharacterized protein n=1 Tax=Cuscuta europaea TaxID=41803 RepID=A0A9P0YPR3_CUSEU|nr:unnamed protein product [Cuscuta europaea]